VKVGNPNRASRGFELDLSGAGPGNLKESQQMPSRESTATTEFTQTGASEEMGNLARNLGEIYLSNDLSALIQFKQDYISRRRLQQQQQQLQQQQQPPPVGHLSGQPASLAALFTFTGAPSSPTLVAAHPAAPTTAAASASGDEKELDKNVRMFRGSVYYKIKCHVLRILATIFSFPDHIEVRDLGSRFCLCVSLSALAP
jgi:hypothetical protein